MPVRPCVWPVRIDLTIPTCIPHPLGQFFGQALLIVGRADSAGHESAKQAELSGIWFGTLVEGVSDSLCQLFCRLFAQPVTWCSEAYPSPSC